MTAPQPGRWWPAPQPEGMRSATIYVPGSKSLTNRHLVLAALAEGTSVIRGPLISRDTLLMAQALGELGVNVCPVGDDGVNDWVIHGGLHDGDGTIECGLAGTVMRFVPPLAALRTGCTQFDGDTAASRRPMQPLLAALGALGVTVTGEAVPFCVHGTGTVAGGSVTLNAEASSQFVSGLLLAGSQFTNGLRVQHQGGPLPSRPHVTMTTEALRDVGVMVDDSSPDSWLVEPTELHQTDIEIEPDLSSATVFLAAAVATGTTVTIPGWPAHTTQAGDAAREMFSAMGAQVALDRTGLHCRGTGTITGITADLGRCGELTPVLAAVAALADSPSTFTGIGHLRGHETDRLSALARELTAVGCTATATKDTLEITPGRLKPVDFYTYDDHRIAQAGCLLGLVVPGMRIQNVATTAKTLPGFDVMWSHFAAGHDVVRAPRVTEADVLPTSDTLPDADTKDHMPPGRKGTRGPGL